jgi:hypothetical protein
MATKNITLETINIGSVRRHRVIIKKDGVVWNLASGVVTIRYEKPDRETQFDRTMIAEDATAGIFYYDTTTSEIDTTGWWTASIRVVDSTVTVWYPYVIGFRVNDQP